MKRLILPLALAALLSACGDSSDVEIYNENNTTVMNGVVYNIDEKPINGVYKIYYSNGNVRMEIESKNGKPNGEGKFYNEDGVLNYSAHFIDGVLDGAMLNYYPDGRVHNELHYTDGKMEGAQKTFDEKGALTVEAVFEKGKAVSGYTVIDGKKVELIAEELASLE
ncbi:MAG: hypothetical protein J6Y91_04210 [Alphaproteobacteria bacterium]|nr:hypothetical protein [Alphaproteobacteria bacterium]